MIKSSDQSGRARTPALAEYHVNQQELDAATRCLAAGLQFVAEHDKPEGHEQLRLRVRSASSHWSGTLPFRVSRLSEYTADSQRQLAELMVVRSLANLEGYVTRAGGLVSAIGAKGDVETESSEGSDASKSLLSKLKDLLGAEFEQMSAGRKHEIACIKLFTFLRHRVAHSFSTGSAGVKNLLASSELAESWLKIETRSGRVPPALPRIEGKNVLLMPEHAIFSLVLANRIASATDDILLNRIGAAGLTKMAFREVAPRFVKKDPTARVRQLARYMRDELLVRDASSENLTQELQDLEIWPELLRA